MIGLAGLLAWGSLFPAREYCQFLAGFYGVLTLLAFLPGGDTMMGFVPLFRHDIWLHALSAGLGAYAYYGWFYRADGDSTQRRAQAA
jgi:hypothetical protein